MKKLLVTFFLAAILIPNSIAQLQRHDFNFTVGLFSSNFLEAVDSDILLYTGDFNYVSKDIDGATAAIFFTYRYFPSFKWSIGTTVGIERVKGDIQINGANDGRYYSDFFAAAIETDYRYVTKPHLQIYSGVGAGVVYHDQFNELYSETASNEKFNFIYHLNVIGIRVGGTLGIFLEGGYGYKGVAKLGINIQL